ncbi:uncharacterized protein METZ01_LOCUS450337, partial [marine metagenome]
VSGILRKSIRFAHSPGTSIGRIRDSTPTVSSLAGETRHGRPHAIASITDKDDPSNSLGISKKSAHEMSSPLLSESTHPNASIDPSSAVDLG